MKTLASVITGILCTFFFCSVFAANRTHIGREVSLIHRSQISSKKRIRSPDTIYTFHAIVHQDNLSVNEIFDAFDAEFFHDDSLNSNRVDGYLANWKGDGAIGWGSNDLDAKGGLAEIQFVLAALDSQGISIINDFMKRHTGHIVLGHEIVFNQVMALNLVVEVAALYNGNYIFEIHPWTFWGADFNVIDAWDDLIESSLKKKDKQAFLSSLSQKLDPKSVASLVAPYDQATDILVDLTPVFLTQPSATGAEPCAWGWGDEYPIKK